MADEDDKKEETPVADKTPETPPATPPETPVKVEHNDDLRETVRAIEEKVNGLISLVETNVAPNPTDETPVKLPWTHWGN